MYQVAREVLCHTYGRDNRVVMSSQGAFRMPVDFRRSTIPIPVGTVGQFNDEQTVSFDSPVLRAEVVMEAFHVQYDDDVARHLANLEIRPDMRPFSEGVDTDVRYQVFVELADKNGGESYRGHVSVVVIAEVT